MVGSVEVGVVSKYCLADYLVEGCCEVDVVTYNGVTGDGKV